MNFAGKKGDTIHIPKPQRGAANLKVAQAQVTLNAAVADEVIIPINQHFEYSHFIEDITEVQALSSMRRFYTEDAGYALARRVDSSLVELGRGFNGGNAANAAYAGAYIGSDGNTLYTGANQAALTDAAIRRTIQRLDDNDVPMEGRFFLIPPSARNTLMGLNRYTEQAFVGEVGGNNTIRNGEIGNLYGIPVFVSSNCDTATGGARIALLGHRDAAVLVEQQGVRSQTQYKQEFLSTLYTADTLYGVGELRDNSCFGLAVPV